MEIKPVVTKADQRAALKEIESLMSARPEHPAATDSISWRHWSKPGRQNIIRWKDRLIVLHVLRAIRICWSKTLEAKDASGEA